MQPEQPDIDADFELLFCDYLEPILNYLYRLVGDYARAEELAQDTFVKAYGAVDRLPEGANRRAWLYRIATNTAYDQLRRRRLIRWLPLGESDRTPASTKGPEDVTVESDAVQRALSLLPRGQRAVLVLYSVQGYSTREIAQMLGISQGAVKTRLCRARARFRSAYGEGS
jgi:RNA polymerase sigma-70 factor (ECF subfamily)